MLNREIASPEIEALTVPARAFFVLHILDQVITK